MLDKLLSKIESDTLAIKAQREKMSTAIINSDLIEQMVELTIAGKPTKPLMVKLFADAEEEYQDEYESVAELAKQVAISKVDAFNKDS